MSIESTQNVKRSDAIGMLGEKGIRVYSDDSLDRLADLMYEHKESIFENYCVFEDDYKLDEWSTWKINW